MTHHAALAICYAAALLGWWALARSRRDLWPADTAVVFAQPWRELLLGFVAVLAILGLGQLYQHGIKLPVAQGGWSAIVAEASNQLLIYSPVFWLLLLRRQPWPSLLVPGDHLPLRIVFGFGLGTAAVVSYVLLRPGMPGPVAALAAVFAPANVQFLAQVTMEDLAIAMLAVRAAAAFGPGWRVPVLVGVLFAAGHVPAMLGNGVELADLSSLLLDAALATGVIRLLLLGRDVTWLFGLHFAMDMTQFLAAA